MERKIKRFIENKYDTNNIDIKIYKNRILKEISTKEKLFDLEYPPNANKSIDSLGKKKYDTSFYTGTGGNIYLYWRQYLFYKKSKISLGKFSEALQTNINILNNLKANNFTNSFFMGDSGIFLFCCIYGIETKNNNFFLESFRRLIGLKNLGNNQELELELLYGLTGYLYSLLFLKKYLIAKKKEAFFNKEENLLNEIIKDLFFEIIKKGIKFMNQYKWDKCLLYPFPLNNEDSTFYLGAAHGLIGVLYLLLCTIKIFPNLLNCEDKNITYLIKEKFGDLKNLFLANLNYIKSLQINSTGNFPDDVEGRDSGDKVHFCHGCVGAVHLYLIAEELFPSNNFKNVAIKCNKCLWERGLLLKGNGICHGMSGTCYALMKLYQFTKEELYLKECLAVANATFDSEIQKKISKFVDPQRRVVGKPDYPYSLMEGDGGLLIMYYDLISLINGDDDCMVKVFPGYEIY